MAIYGEYAKKYETNKSSEISDDVLKKELLKVIEEYAVIIVDGEVFKNRYGKFNESIKFNIFDDLNNMKITFNDGNSKNILVIETLKEKPLN